MQEAERSRLVLSLTFQHAKEQAPQRRHITGIEIVMLLFSFILGNLDHHYRVLAQCKVALPIKDQ